MNINKILSKLFGWIWKSQGDYQADAVANERENDADEEQKRVPVIHRKCGGQTGWYLRDKPRNPDVMYSKDYIRMDGSHPEYGSSSPETCPFCKELVDGNGLKRIFPDQ